MPHFRVITWNCRRAIGISKVWDYLLDIAPDVAFLQEVNAIPSQVLDIYACHKHRAIGKDDKAQRFNTVLLVKGHIGEPIHLQSNTDWVQSELQRFEGNLVACELLPHNAPPIKAICVYSPAWPVDPSRLVGIDVSDVRLTLNRNVWVADLLWASLNHRRISANDRWIVAGDLNLSETFDSWTGGPRGNREYLNRMASLGLTECLRNAKGALTPTFRSPRGGAIKHQIDHMFVTEALASQLVTCDTGSGDHVFGSGISDHLPIIADFDFG